MLDLNGDHSLDMHEAMLAHLSPLFAWLDLDADGLVSMEEMRLVLTTMQDDACDGACAAAHRPSPLEALGACCRTCPRLPPSLAAVLLRSSRCCALLGLESCLSLRDASQGVLAPRLAST